MPDQDNRRHLARVNIGHCSTTFRSTSRELARIILDTVPARAREQGDDHWVIFASSAPDLIRRLSEDGWAIVRWPSANSRGPA